MMKRRSLRVLGIALMTVVSGCSVNPEPTTITVVAKEVQPRWESRVVGLQTGFSGRVVEIRREGLVYWYWLKDIDGRWHRVSRSEWQAAQLGQPLEIRP